MADPGTSGQCVDFGILWVELPLPALWDLWTVQNSLLELRRTLRLAAAPWLYHITAQSELKLGKTRESEGAEQEFGNSETHYCRGERSPENFEYCVISSTF